MWTSFETSLPTEGTNVEIRFHNKMQQKRVWGWLDSMINSDGILEIGTSCYGHPKEWRTF